MRGWIAKHGRGFLPADEETERAHGRVEVGECIPVRFLRVRDITAHRRYWLLMTVCAKNCERIEVAHGVFMEIKTKENVHTAMKLCTGYYDELCDAENRPVARIPKSTNFDEMTADEWAEYWPRVCDVVQEQVLPGVSLPEVQLELFKLMGMASSNAS